MYTIKFITFIVLLLIFIKSRFGLRVEKGHIKAGTTIWLIITLFAGLFSIVGFLIYKNWEHEKVALEFEIWATLIILFAILTTKAFSTFFSSSTEEKIGYLSFSKLEIIICTVCVLSLLVQMTASVYDRVLSKDARYLNKAIAQEADAYAHNFAEVQKDYLFGNPYDCPTSATIKRNAYFRTTEDKCIYFTDLRLCNMAAIACSDQLPDGISIEPIMPDLLPYEGDNNDIISYIAALQDAETKMKNNQLTMEYLGLVTPCRIISTSHHDKYYSKTDLFELAATIRTYMVALYMIQNIMLYIASRKPKKKRNERTLGNGVSNIQS